MDPHNIWNPRMALGLHPDGNTGWRCVGTLSKSDDVPRRCRRPIRLSEFENVDNLLTSMARQIPDQIDYDDLLRLAGACLCGEAPELHRDIQLAEVIYRWIEILATEACILRAIRTPLPRDTDLVASKRQWVVTDVPKRGMTFPTPTAMSPSETDAYTQETTASRSKTTTSNSECNSNSGLSSSVSVLSSLPSSPSTLATTPSHHTHPPAQPPRQMQIIFPPTPPESVGASSPPDSGDIQRALINHLSTIASGPLDSLIAGLPSPSFLPRTSHSPPSIRQGLEDSPPASQDILLEQTATLQAQHALQEQLVTLKTEITHLRDAQAAAQTILLALTYLVHALVCLPLAVLMLCEECIPHVVEQIRSSPLFFPFSTRGPGRCQDQCQGHDQAPALPYPTHAHAQANQSLQSSGGRKCLQLRRRGTSDATGLRLKRLGWNGDTEARLGTGK